MLMLRRPRPERRPLPLADDQWQLLDDALDQLDRHLGVPVPERGAALLAVTGSRLVTEIVPDPVPGQGAAYYHSDELRVLVNRRLAAAPWLRYAGTAHSHPGCYDEPSQPDHVAFASTLRSNPLRRSMLFPLVVRVPIGEVCVGSRYGRDHLVELEHGTLAAYTAFPYDGERGGVLVRPAGVSTLRVRASLVEAAAWTIGEGSAVSAGVPVPGPGGVWLRYAVSAAGDPVADLLVPQTFPLAAPLVLRPADGSLWAPRWEATLGADGQVARALTEAIAETGAVAS